MLTISTNIQFKKCHFYNSCKLCYTKQLFVFHFADVFAVYIFVLAIFSNINFALTQILYKILRFFFNTVLFYLLLSRLNNPIFIIMENLSTKISTSDVLISQYFTYTLIINIDIFQYDKVSSFHCLHNCLLAQFLLRNR